MSDHDSYQQMLAAMRSFHHKHDFRKTCGDELTYRITLMTEELGEISACATKGKPQKRLTEECADLLILLPRTVIAANFDPAGAFRCRLGKITHDQQSHTRF